MSDADYRQVDRKKLTPMLQHFLEIKDQYPDAMILYRVGDFYETFFQDAQTASRQLELVLTSKQGGRDVGRVPMTGVPYHALERYVEQLMQKGHVVVICDRVENSPEGKLHRKVTRVITPTNKLISTPPETQSITPSEPDNTFIPSNSQAGNSSAAAEATVWEGNCPVQLELPLFSNTSVIQLPSPEL
ncbi:MAG: hypothetical protein LDL41_03280 [Coleofasciculus sp. S288]|nr:hypothetical protein [Coleofasciculus sp. S288]